MQDYKNPVWYLELYRKYHAHPVNGYFTTGNGGLCAVGVACLDFGVNLNQGFNAILIDLAEKLGAEERFLRGITMGFDFPIEHPTMSNEDFIHKYLLLTEGQSTNGTWLEGVLLGRDIRQLVEQEINGEGSA